ncbi:hypothetical protein A3754_08015 [Alcanivorax sp. HI0083]|uniref:DUF262 domain-containing protein n=1 Tax=unclassified Alcanivorax TaxID=2638842 RepID=UPI0007B9AC3E|nr:MULTISPECIES: DUF262 domain-containing protein [unclassified Alcanivorax]KZY38763.1 hypothetical protein A3730_09975 [Alcanivorax sp. HI0044]KZZ27338.1 hypothetical protein A3754_08015 [Alcanivorax sp. HI0083]
MIIETSDPDIESIIRRIGDRIINLQPDFQRDLVWSQKKQQCLVDTVIRGWKFPPVYVVAVNDSSQQDVLDGQQRLNALFEFVNDAFPVDGNIEPKSEDISHLHGLYFSQLPPDTKNKLLRYPVRIHELHDYQSDEPSEIFFRLNQGSTLTPAEKRNTFYGPVRDQIKLLVNHMESLDIDSRKIGFNNSRLSYHDVMSRFVFAIHTGTINEKITDSDLVMMYRSQNPVASDTIEICEQAITNFESSIQGKVKLNKATLLTWLMYFYFEDEPNERLVHQFESEREQLKKESNDLFNFSKMRKILSIYQERSSSSVNDAIPVQLRLLCIFIFSIESGQTPNSPQGEKAKKILELINFSEDSYSESKLIEIMKSVQWGHL